MRWRIYYGDGSTFDNTMGTPEAAPPTNVQVIVAYSPENGRELFHKWDWYFYKNGWWGCDIHGLLDKLMHERGIITVKQGRTISLQIYKMLVKQATDDPDFPPKSADIPLDAPKQAYGEGVNG